MPERKRCGKSHRSGQHLSIVAAWLLRKVFSWRKRENHKQAFHIHRSDYGLFAVAGLWEHHQLNQDSLYSCTVITTAASEFMLPIHERMPVIIPKDHYTDWLDKADDDSQVYSLLDNQAYGEMLMTPVSDWVNNPRHVDAQCIEQTAKLADLFGSYLDLFPT